MSKQYKHTGSYIIKSRLFNTIVPLIENIDTHLHNIPTKYWAMYYKRKDDPKWNPTPEELKQLECDLDLLFKIKMVIREHK